jgi:prophage antirepressor-like protein
MNEIKVFENAEFGKVRTIEVDGIPYFVGKDVAEILGYSNPQKAIRDHIDEEDKTLNEMFTVNGTMATLINESGLYSLILSSKMPNAKRFKRWVTSEVLPSIRKTGSYQRPMTQAEILAQQAQLLVEMERKTNEAKAIAEQTQNKLDGAIDLFTSPTTDNWKDETNRKINAMCMTNNLNYQKFKGDLYAELEQLAHCDISARQRNLRERLKKAGATYRERQAITKIDVIARDEKLKLIFDGIVKKYQAKYLEG